MNIYDIILKKIKDVRMETGDERPVSNIAASSMLTAEITLISSLLIAVVMLRLLNKTLMIVLVVVLFVLAFLAMPIMPTTQKGAERFTGQHELLCYCCTWNHSNTVLLGEFKCLMD